MSVSRRGFIVGSVSTGVLAAGLSACEDDSKGGNAEGDAGADGGVDGKNPLMLPVDTLAFAHGIASGDPLQDRVILWTRVSGLSKDASVSWLIAKDPELQQVIDRGEAEAKANADFTVKVDVDALEEGTAYYYLFWNETGRTMIGRTRTLPGKKVDRARIAFTSCANYANGYFHAYAAIAKRSDLDLWVHLGDYIYEYAEGVYPMPAFAERPLVPVTETITLSDYRQRYAHYRGDPDLQEIHRQHPLIVVWDDHETANNSYKDGAENHMPATEGDWETRKKAATQAFLEWLPIRVSGSELPPKIYREFQFGDLFDLLMLDTRLIGRDKQAGTDMMGDVGDPSVWTDPNRSLLGEAQTDWFLKGLSASQDRGAIWRLIGNQIIFSPTRDPRSDTNAITFSDFWDGYQASRKAVTDHIAGQMIDNVVFLTGDIHSAWVFETPADPWNIDAYDPVSGRGALAVEFVGMSVTSQALEGDPLAAAAPALLKQANPHLKFSEFTRKGYVLVDVTQQRVQGEWYWVSDVRKQDEGKEELAVAFSCDSGTAHLVETKTATKPLSGAPKPAPTE